MHISPFQYLIWKKKKSLYICFILEVNISVGELVCFKSDSFPLEYQGMNLVTVLGFIKWPQEKRFFIITDYNSYMQQPLSTHLNLLLSSWKVDQELKSFSVRGCTIGIMYSNMFTKPGKVQFSSMNFDCPVGCQSSKKIGCFFNSSSKLTYFSSFNFMLLSLISTPEYLSFALSFFRPAAIKKRPK